MRKGKLFTLLVLFVMLVSLTVGIQAQDDVVTIEYWQYFFEARQGAMNQLIEQFEAENPDIDVVHNSEIPYADFITEVSASAAAGVGPDVVTLFYGWIPAWVEAGFLVPLPQEDFPQDWIESFFSPMVSESKFQGEYWAIPTAVRALALFYNKDLMEAAGLDPDSPPETLDELVEMAQATTQYDGDASLDNITTQGFAAALAGQSHHWFREVLIRQFGGVPYSEDGREVLWNSEAGCEAFSYLADFELEYATGSNALLDGATNAFVNGLSAFHIDGSFRIGTINNNNPDLNYGVTELPAGPNGDRSTFGSYWTHGITRNAAEDEAKMEAATRFLQFITTAEAGTLWVNEVGELPAQLEAASNPDLLADPILGPFAASLEYARATFFIDESAQRQVLIDAYELVREGVDPCEALDLFAPVEQELLDDFWASQD
ncbi:MAG: extracellular solute-binding protein [Anaerolineae bacterium]|nr:extracellular solute-binding protein [Anaerolineae bacterium]MDQ7033853.1 extracellular solute-binding protein [Anaerolineae bacterium]